MERAIDLSIENVEACQGGPFGAVIVKHGIIIGEGANQVVAMNDPTAHAEIVAIRRACKTLGTFDLSGCTIYSSCEPCSMCYSAIRWSRIEHIYYSNTRQDAANIGFSDADIYGEIEKGQMKSIHLPTSRSIEAFDKWLIDNNNINY
jgi:tRNA(Arg) A34 adenosine deaminase TadA